MRLCLLGPAGHLHVQRWARAFAARGHEIHLISWETPPNAAGISYHPLPRLGGPLRLPRQVGRIRGLLKAIGPDVVHAHWLIVYGWLGWLSGFSPYVISVWGSDVHVLARRRLPSRLLSYGALRSATIVTASSRDLLERARALGARAKRLELVRWGVDLARFHPGVADEPLRADLGLAGRPVVLSPRGPAAVYRPETAIEAMRLLRQEVPAAVLVQISDLHRPEHRKLQERVAAAGLQGAVRLVPRLPHERMPGLFGLADVVLSITATDSTAISLLEGMACGTFPVISDIAANREALDEQRALFVPVGDAAALAAALAQVLRDPERRRRAAAANRRWVERHADATAQMDRMEQLYQRIIGRAAEAAPQAAL